jgi:hypothetical protein
MHFGFWHFGFWNNFKRFQLLAINSVDFPVAISDDYFTNEINTF